MLLAALAIERFALDVIEQHLRLVRSDKQVIALKTVDPLGIIGGIGRRMLVRLTLLDLFAGSHGIGIGLAVKPGVIGLDVVHVDPGLAEPARKAVSLVCLGQAFRPCGGLLLKRYRRIALGQALSRSRQHSAHGKGVGVRGRLINTKLGCLDGRGARAGKIGRCLNALAMHGNIQFVIHRPLIGVRATQGLIVSSRAFSTGTEIIVMLFPQLTRGIALVVPRAIAVALSGTVAAKRGDFLFGRVALAVASKAHAWLKVALGNFGIILVGARSNTAQVHIVLNDGDHGDGIVLTRAQVTRKMAANELVALGRQNTTRQATRPCARHGDNAHVRRGIAVALRRREAVDNLGVTRHAAHKTRGIHVVAAQSANSHVVLIGDVGHAIRGNRAVLLARRCNAAVLNRRICNIAGKRRHIQTLTAERLHARGRIVDGTAATDLAVVEGAAVELAGDETALKACVGNEVESIVGAGHVQRALHDHNVFEARFDGLAHDNATAEVRPHVGVLDQEVFDGGTVGLGKKSRIALGVKSVFIVAQALNGVVLTIEHALKRMLLVAKRQMLNGVRDNGLHVVIIKHDIVIEINAPAGRIALTRKRHVHQKVVRVFDVVFVCVLGHVLGMHHRWQRHNAAKGNRRDGN